MDMRPLLLGLALAVLATPAAAQRAIPTADLAKVSARGSAIYAFDQAAWHTTDTMIARHLPDAVMHAIRGWVVEPHGDALRVTYFGMDGDKPYAIYIADYGHDTVTDERMPAAGDADRALTPLAARLAAARITAVAAGDTIPRCIDKPYNTVTLPPEADGTIPVYLLTPQTVNDRYPMGGHHEIDIAADGSVAAKRDFTHSCLEIGPAEGERPGKTAMLFITHLLDPHPTEIHVFTSLSAHYPVLVGTGATEVWSVEGARIGKIDPKKLRGAPSP
jgi:hypothetical protein